MNTGGTEGVVIIRSPWPDIDIPVVPLTDYVLGHAAERGDDPALIDGITDRTLTFGELAQHVDNLAAGLQRRGLAKGDVVGVHLPNRPEYAVTFFGVARAGGVNTTLNPLLTEDELASQLNDSRARFLVTVPELASRAVAAGKRAPVEEVFVVGEAEGATPFAALLSNDGNFKPVDIDPLEDPVVLPYSSGTTGLPKGVMLTHHNLVANLRQIRATDTIVSGDVLIGVLPFYHIYGMVVIMAHALSNGASVVTMPRFDFETFLRIIQHYGVTKAHLVPPIILALAKHPLVESYDLSSLKVIMSGAAPLGEDLVVACANRLGTFVKQGYGLTETSPVTNINPEDPALNKPSTVGPLVPNTEARIVDLGTGLDCDTGERGELLVRGPQVMKGYLNRPDATAAMIDGDGWLHTGDVAFADADGYITIVDRIKELIKYNAYQVAPAELEAVLNAHPAVADAAVIPSPDPETGEVPKAYVVLRSPATEDELMTYVAERVAPFKKIRRIEFVDQIPKSASGKILRRLLIERDRAAGDR